MAQVDAEPVLISRYLAPYSGDTLTGHYRIMFDWLAWCVDARVHLLAVERLHIEQWVKSLLDAGQAKSTIAGKLSVVCGFYRWAFEEGLTPRDVGAYVRRPSKPRRSNQKWLDAGEAARALDASVEAGAPWGALVHLLLLNGLRLGETLAARVEDLGRQDDFTTLHLPSRKGGVMDTVSLPMETVRQVALTVGRRVKGRILTLDGKALTQGRVYGAMDSISRAADLGFSMRPHMLRATFVTLSLDAGVDPRDVMASTGHAHMAMVDYYDRAHASIRRNASHRLADFLDDKRQKQ